MKNVTNPILQCDYPDPDVIRVDDAYYMVSTTMYFMPGCPILRSYDLANWEVVSYVYDTLEDNEAHSLSGAQNIYGCGMWAASLRYHRGTYYICFVANDTHKTYLFTAKNIEGPWEKHEIQGFYHDCSLLFEEDRVYIVYGNSEIHLTQLRPDLSGPLEGGLDRVILRDGQDIPLGYEGSHLYKLWGKYYLFVIHAAKRGTFFRTEACFVADSLEGEFRGGDIVQDDMGFFGNGVAQGGVVDTPDGDWYLFLFQDRGAAGRIPVLVPMRWENDFPVIDGVPEALQVKSTHPEHRYAPLWGDDDFSYADGEKLKNFWQWNHNPDNRLWRAENGKLEITTDKLCANLCQAKNTLTQRSAYPRCYAEVTADASRLNEGDYMGIAALLSGYGAIAVTLREGRPVLVVLGREIPAGPDGTVRSGGLRLDMEPPAEYAQVALDAPIVRIGVELDFTDLRDEARFYYFCNGEKRAIGPVHKLYFRLDHFTGCRPALFVYSTQKTGGTAVFADYRQSRMGDCLSSASMQDTPGNCPSGTSMQDTPGDCPSGTSMYDTPGDCSSGTSMQDTPKDCPNTAPVNSPDGRLRVGVVGAGAISGRYIDTIQKKFPAMEIVCVCAGHMESAQRRAREFGLKACTFEEMLADASIDLILNLTPVGAHYGIIRRALLAGKHVYTEKTMTDDPQTAKELAALAKEKHLYLGSAPDTFLGAAVQTARKAVDDGLIGEVTSFSIAANRNNNILLSMFSFLRQPGAGICYDYAVYYITALVSILGPAQRVAAVVRAPYQTHVNVLPQSPEYGQTMDTPNESEVSAVLQMKSGISGTFMVNADNVMADQAHFALYGTKGILYLTDPNQFGGDVMLLRDAENPALPPISEKLPPVNPYEQENRGLGAADLADAIENGRQPRASMEQAVHVLDVLHAMLESGRTGAFVELETSCERPLPLTGEMFSSKKR